MEINGPNLESIWYQFSMLYAAAYERTQIWSPRIAMTAPSTTRENRYAWLKLIPRMREWVGERVMQNLLTSDYALVNKPFELSVSVKKEDIEDDQLGIFVPAVGTIGEQAKRWPDDLVLQVLQGATSMLCYDGQPYFSASHPTYAPASAPQTYQNYWSSGMPLTAANFATVKTAMDSYIGEDGKPLAVNGKLLIVPPQLRQTAAVILNAEIIAPTVAMAGNAANVMQSNVLRGWADVLVIPELAGAPTEWYLADDSKVVKPFVFQQRKAPSQTSLTDPTSDHVFMRKEYIYGADARGNAGFSLPFLCAKARA